MRMHAAITVHRSREEVERLWDGAVPEGATVGFAEAPGDRGTEIHVTLAQGGLVQKVTGGGSALAKVKDELRRFKRRVETGELSRSSELEEAGVR